MEARSHRRRRIGAPLSTILDRAGLKRPARHVMPQGLDDLLVRRPMSITEAFAEDTIVAYAMNGERCPPDHGFPVRVLTPGRMGVANIQWVGRRRSGAEVAQVGRVAPSR